MSRLLTLQRALLVAAAAGAAAVLAARATRFPSLAPPSTPAAPPPASTADALRAPPSPLAAPAATAPAAPPAAPALPPARAPSTTSAHAPPEDAAVAVVRAPWGVVLGALGHKLPSEGAPEGPMSFAVDAAGRVAVLDQVNERIAIFEAGHAREAVPVHSETYQDLELAADGGFVLLDRLARASVAFLDPTGRLLHEVPLAGPHVREGGATTGLFRRADGVWVELEHRRMVRIADPSGAPDPEQREVPGRLTPDGRSLLRAQRALPSAVTLLLRPLGADERALAAPTFPLPVARITGLEVDGAGRVDLAVLLHAPESDTEQQLLVQLTPDGREIARRSLPVSEGPEEVFRSVRLGADGAVYSLQCTPDGVTVWKVQP